MEDTLSYEEHANPWQWQDGHNPYLRTPLQILGLAAGTPGRAAVRTAARRRRLRAERGGDRFPLFGRPVEAVEVNTAEQELTTPTGRLLAELRTHRPPDSSRDAALASQLESLKADFGRLTGTTTAVGADRGPGPGEHGRGPGDHGPGPGDHGSEPGDHGPEPGDHGPEPGKGAAPDPAHDRTPEPFVLARPEALLGWLPVRPPRVTPRRDGGRA
ncbi:hypothetical protein [Streptomyces triticagri]|uniref:hypothetical protein n=1 Tax=Streptomyces triticagri TaxID=2293568 RepID=UPI0013140A59|nr:hypothetical protein [Streptomyces triticagri]